MNHVFRSLSVGTRQWKAFSRPSFLHQPLTSSRRKQVQTFQCRRSFWSKLFGNKKDVSAKYVDVGGPKLIYPDSLLLYFAGRRTIYVGCMNLATTYPFLLTLFYIAPNIEAEWPSLMKFSLVAEHPHLTGVIVASIAALPMGMFYLAAPYVTHMYVKIPMYARVSKSAVMNWVKTIPPDTKLRIFTMRTLGRPKMVEVPLNELRWCKKRLGCVNLEWKHMQNLKPKYKDFYVEQKGGSSKAAVHDAFKEILKQIQERTMNEKLGITVKPATQTIPANITTIPVSAKPLSKVSKKANTKKR